MILGSIRKNSLILTAFALCASALLALTYIKTKDKIADAQKRAAQKALYEIIPESRVDNDLLEDTWLIPSQGQTQLNIGENAKAHIARKNNRVIGVIFPTTAPDGYSGDIQLIVGVFRDGSIAGVRALAHKETPGLGDKVDINKSDWITGFNGASLTAPTEDRWSVKKDGGDFDQFTGATITPRAVVNKVKHVLDYYDANKAVLLALPQKLDTNSAANNE